MSNLSQSDLILAGRFVDGDLPAHEAAQAESRIAKDADFAAAVEQIRDQSSLLGRLPKFTPSDDLADRTLQTSIDQVKAINGAWPVESEVEKVTVASGTSSFDWKSTAALIASLAGVFTIGAMLWLNSQPNESNVAMGELPAVASAPKSDDDGMFKKSPSMPEFEADEMEVTPLQSIAQSELQQPSNLKSGRVSGKEFAMSGTPSTPMKRARPGQQTIQSKSTASNASSPVSQIWCVSQDSNASKKFVSDILTQNRIAVQREEQPQTAQTPDVVEAFYVAATPTQMKLAMSQISNAADIEMIEIPSGDNSPIADAIQQQFTQSNVMPNDSAAPNEIANLPPKFEPSQALAQQLISNSFARSLPGPVPPILESGDPIEGLNSKASRGAGNLAKGPAAKAPGGAGGMGGGAAKEKSPSIAANAMADASPVQQQQASPPMSRQQAQLDKYLDDSNQLKQYLILVRGGGENR